MITLAGLTKRYGDVIAVDDLSLDVRAGAVTGFLGPNGAGKTSTIKMLLGLCEPTSGSALIDGRRYRDLRWPLRELADQGRTVLLSSHLLSEMSLTADRVAVIGHGRLLADTTLDDFVEHHSAPRAHVRSADQVALAVALERAGARVSPKPDGALHVTAMTPTRIGEIALSCGIAISELMPLRTDLEAAFFAATQHAVDYADRSTS